MNIPVPLKKPRLKTDGVMWMCYGPRGFAKGFTPEEAYRLWLTWTHPREAFNALVKSAVIAKFS